MKRPIELLCIVVFSALSATAFAQQNGSSGAQVGTGATGFYQSQVYSGISSPPAGGTAVPYYVEPSRFFYNRPATSNTSPAGNNITVSPGRSATFFQRRGRPFYGYYPQWNGRVAYRYGPYVYYPRVYQVAPGVTQHIGPFVPLH